MERDAPGKLAIRRALYEAVQGRCPGAVARQPEAYPDLDDTVLNLESPTRSAAVFVCEDVTWGPQIATYVRRTDAYRDCPELVVEVPNTIDGAVSAIVEALEAWFTL